VKKNLDYKSIRIIFVEPNNKTMDKYQCTECKWEGVEDERVEVKVPHTDFACPKCGCTFLVNLTEEEYITNWSRTINPNDL
jgi:predicted RNA-binding Zn-ribbon protein involved in translation (DUF1610 family)